MLSILIPTVGGREEGEARSPSKLLRKRQGGERSREEQVVDTTHTIAIGGKKPSIGPGPNDLLKRKWQTEATIFYVAYTNLGVKGPRSRPITFLSTEARLFSVWCIWDPGPLRVTFDDEEWRCSSLTTDGQRVFDSRPNRSVFNDPVSTGYSRRPKGKAQGFHGVYGDNERSEIHPPLHHAP